jgi:hypothetical protein
MRIPVICADGLSYERANIERWLLKKDTSQIASLLLTNKMLIPNLTLRNTINE